MRQPPVDTSVAAVIPVDDPDDPRVAAYRHIRERDLVGREGQFIAEGEVVLERLLRAPRHRAVSLLIAEKRVAGLAPLLAQVAADVPVYAAGQAVMDAVVGFNIHRGILALGRRADPVAPADLLAGLPARALVVALCGLANHDNMGGVFRNAAAFGADAVLLDSDCCDPLYRKAIRVGVGAPLIMPFARFQAGEDVVTTLTAAGFEPLALSPSGTETLAGLARPPRAAVILGAEGPGLPAGLLARARTVAIRMHGGFDSLNVATTSGIVLHQLSR